MGYGLSGTAHIYDWIAATAESERIDVLLVWLKGACRSPQEACTGQVSHSIRQRRFFYADIPVARTRVTYQVVDVPARCVHILRISDDDFGMPGDDG